MKLSKSTLPSKTRTLRKSLILFLAIFIAQPFPNQINEANENLAPTHVPYVPDSGFVKSDLQVPLASRNYWTPQGTKVLGTMLEPNAEGSFTLPPKRRVMGLAKDPENKEGLYKAGGNWHGRPSKAIQERIVDNFQGEIAMTADLQQAIFRVIRQIAANKDLNKDNWPKVVSSDQFREKVGQETEVTGKTLSQYLYIIEKLGGDVVSGKLKVKADGALQSAFTEILQIFLGPDEVIVETIAAGLNANGDWASTGFPVSIIRNDFHVLGSDLYGRVVAVGRNVTRFKVQDRVVFQTGMHDKNDPDAHGGHPGKLKSYHITGYEDPIGTFTDFYKNDALSFMPITEEEIIKKVLTVGENGAARPPFVEEMASYGLVLPTVEHALNRLGVSKESIVIMEGGNGGTGRYGIQAAKARGAFVIAVVSDNSRGKEVLELGADAYINRKDSKLVQVDNDLLFLDDFLKKEKVVPQITHSMVLDHDFSLPELRQKLEGFLIYLKGTTLEEAIKSTRKNLEKLSEQLAPFPYNDNYSRLRRSVENLLAIESFQPGFVFRSFRVLNANATFEDVAIVNADYIDSVKEAVKKIWTNNRLTRKSYLADAVINFMGTKTYGRHALSVRNADLLDGEDFGGSVASFGGGTGFKVQYPGEEGVTNIATMMKRISKYRRRAEIDDHIKKVVVMGATEGAREEVKEMVRFAGSKVLVVVRSQEEVNTVLGWGLLRKGVDGIISTSAPKQKIITSGTIENKIEELRQVRNLPFQKQPVAMVVDNAAEKKQVIDSGWFDQGMDLIYSRDEDYVVTELGSMDVNAIEKQKVDDKKTGKSRNYIFLVLTPAEKRAVLNIYMKEKNWVKRGMFDPKKDLFLEPYAVQMNLDNPMPEAPTPLDYTPTEQELKEQAKKDRAYSEWLSNDARGLGKAIWSHWGKGSAPDLIFGRASWPTALASAMYVLDNFGQIAMRGDMSKKIYDFDIRYFWMFQKVLLTSTQAMIGTHYASTREANDAHKLVREGGVKLAPVTVYPWHEVGKAQEEMVKGKNVILVGSPKPGLRTLQDIRDANLKRFEADLKSEELFIREQAKNQLHYQASLQAGKAIFPVASVTRKGIFEGTWLKGVLASVETSI